MNSARLLDGFPLLGAGYTFVVFLLFAPVKYSGALTFIAKTKQVKISDDWRITGSYDCLLETSHTDDARKINQMIRQLEQQPGRFSKVLTDQKLKLLHGT